MIPRSLPLVSLATSVLLTACSLDAQLATQLVRALQTSSQNVQQTRAKSSANSVRSQVQNALETDAQENVLTHLLDVNCEDGAFQTASTDDALTESETPLATSSSSAEQSPDSSSESAAPDALDGDNVTSERAAQASVNVASESEATERTDVGSENQRSESAPSSDSENTVLRPEQALVQADTIRPVVLAPPDPAPTGGAQRVHRIQLDARLQLELGRMNRLQGSERQRYYQGLQARYPEMRHAWPVPLRTRQAPQMTQIIFVQMPSFKPRPSVNFDDSAPVAQRPVRRPVTVSARALLAGMGDLPCQPPGLDAEADSES